MDLPIFALLTQDGVTNGAVYALLALALVLVFTVTRVIFVPSGELVAYGTLTLAGLQFGKPPATIGLLVGMAVIAGVMEIARLHRAKEMRQIPRRLLVVDRHSGGARRQSQRGSRRRSFRSGRRSSSRWRSSLRSVRCSTGSRISRSPKRACSCCSSSRSPCISRSPGSDCGSSARKARVRRRFRRASFDIAGVNVSVQSLLVVLTSIALDRGALLLLRPHALRQGAARDGVQSRRRAAGGHRPESRRIADLRARGPACAPLPAC